MNYCGISPIYIPKIHVLFYVSTPLLHFFTYIYQEMQVSTLTSYTPSCIPRNTYVLQLHLCQQVYTYHTQIFGVKIPNFNHDFYTENAPKMILEYQISYIKIMKSLKS